MPDSTTVFGTLTLLASAVITYLLKEYVQVKRENVKLKGLLTRAILAGQQFILTDNDLDRKQHLAGVKVWEQLSKDILLELYNKKSEKED
jgi:hypothetical protein